MRTGGGGGGSRVTSSVGTGSVATGSETARLGDIPVGDSRLGQDRLGGDLFRDAVFSDAWLRGTLVSLYDCRVRFGCDGRLQALRRTVGPPEAIPGFQELLGGEPQTAPARAALAPL